MLAPPFGTASRTAVPQLESYLEQFPEGTFAALAQIKLGLKLRNPLPLPQSRRQRKRLRTLAIWRSGTP
jgi:hypothetical protein